VAIERLILPDWETLLLKSLPDGRAPCPPPRQNLVTSFLLRNVSQYSPDYLTEEGQKRLDTFKEIKIDVVTNETNFLPPLERCITNPRGKIKFCPVAFLALTPGVASACPFNFNLWRNWFCFW
jgi:hypothetical protein